MATFCLNNFVNDPSPNDRLMYIYNCSGKLVMSIDPYASTFTKRSKYVYILTDGQMNYDNVLDFDNEGDSELAVARLNDIKKVFIDRTNSNLDCGVDGQDGNIVFVSGSTCKSDLISDNDFYYSIATLYTPNINITNITNIESTSKILAIDDDGLINSINLSKILGTDTGSTWLNPVDGFSNYTGCTNDGDIVRYIASNTSNGWTQNYVYQCNGDGLGWVETIPQNGYTVVNDEDNKIYIYDSVSGWTTSTSAGGSSLWQQSGPNIFNTNSGNVQIRNNLNQGHNNTIIGVDDVALNKNNYLNGDNSIISGDGNKLYGNNSFIFSYHSELYGDRSVILGGQNISGVSNDTVYVPYLSILSANTNNTLNNILVLDNDGNVLIRNSNTIITTSITWNNVLNTPTTLSGYTITDAYTKSEVNVLLSANTGVNGGVFIYDVTPTSNGNVGDKTYIDGIIIDSCLSDTQNITLDIVAVIGNTKYKPTVNVFWGSNSGTVTNFVEGSSTNNFQGKWRGSIDINLSGENSITVVHEDGATHTISVLTDNPPIIQNAIFTGGYPGSQTELKENDEYDLYIESDIDFVEIEIENYGSFKSDSENVSSTTGYTITGIIANRGTSTQNLGAKIRVRKYTGSWSDWYLTENDGSVDGVNLVKLNNLYPSVSISTISYPGVQQALKNNESATVTNTVTNYDTITYSSPNSELSIVSENTYETNKSVSRINGSYNINTNNIRIVAVRTANAATTTVNDIVNIANVAATLTVTEPASRLRSGGNNGTSIQSHTITITSNQNLLEAPSLETGLTWSGGTWDGSGFVGSTTTWARNLLVYDDMPKGSYTWGNILGTNLAGIETNTITGENTYTFGGFVSREITLQAYQNETEMNVEAVDYTKVTINWEVKTLPNKRSVGTTTTPDPNSWCLESLNTNPTTIRILDTAATLGSSVPTTITIQESV